MLTCAALSLVLVVSLNREQHAVGQARGQRREARPGLAVIGRGDYGHAGIF